MWVHTACLIYLGYCHFVYNAPFLYAGITQWLERQFSKLKVVGSSPSRQAIKVIISGGSSVGRALK